MHPQYFRYAMLATTGLTIVLAICIMSTAAHTLSVYNSQHATNPWWLPAWSDHFDVHGTMGLIGAAVGTIILNGANLVLSFLPSLNLANRPTMRALFTLAANVPSALVTLSTVILAHVLNHMSPDYDTIQTWTCRFDQTPPMGPDHQMQANLSNNNFSQLCQESVSQCFTRLV
jgi:hypothetical protein